MTIGIVDFLYEEWIATYPEFSEHTTEGQANHYFSLACLYLNNSPSSIVSDTNQRQTLLWLLVAHLAQLGTNASSSGSSSGVGRVASASRGSVSVSFDGSALPNNAGWFTQTQYGLTFWQATAQFRQMRFIPGRSHPARIWP